jgi:hypothetical protein
LLCQQLVLHLHLCGKDLLVLPWHGLIGAAKVLMNWMNPINGNCLSQNGYGEILLSMEKSCIYIFHFFQLCINI